MKKTKNENHEIDKKKNEVLKKIKARKKTKKIFF